MWDVIYLRNAPSCFVLNNLAVSYPFPSYCRQVPSEDGEAIAKELGVMFIEASAKNGANVKQVRPRCSGITAVFGSILAMHLPVAAQYVYYVRYAAAQAMVTEAGFTEAFLRCDLTKPFTEDVALLTCFRVAGCNS